MTELPTTAVAQRLGVTPRRVRQLRDAIGGWRMVAGRLVFTQVAVEAYRTLKAYNRGR